MAHRAVYSAAFFNNIGAKWHQAAGQPHQLDVALALPLQAPTRLLCLSGFKLARTNDEVRREMA